ncbi:MAG: hypothetical protein K9K64_05925 [Desulfohalobiaceae bacterium]|nr:hypothetical protein [Desulfohalobiaceae bacterium]
MTKDDKELLLKVFSFVFEGFAFMFVEMEEDLLAEGSKYNLKAGIEFKSRDSSGFLEIIAPTNFCIELAENILGTESEELPEGAGENALKEVLNVSCGCLLAEKFGTKQTFDLSIPEISPVSAEQWDRFLAGRDHAFFSVDESPMLGRLVLSA